MSCCCSSDAESSSPISARRKLEFSKVYSSGFEKEKKTVYHSDDIGEKNLFGRTQSDSSVQSGYSNEEDSDDDIGDMVFVDGNESDLDECDDEDTLMERVWWLSKPPYVPRQTPVVSARKIQVVKERLSSTIKGLPTIRAAMKEQIDRSLQNRRGSKTREYIIAGKFSTNSHVTCGADEKTSIPVCAKKLSDIF